MVRVRVNAQEHAVQMLSELLRMQQEHIDCDFMIKVENDVYRTHRNVMSAGSAYIRDMLANKRHAPMQLHFTKQDSDCVKSCIDFIYSGELEIPEGKIENVLAFGSLLRLDGVKRVIAGILTESLNMENYFSTRNMAKKYGLKEVSVKCQSFFGENLMEIANRPEFGIIPMVEVFPLLMTEEREFTEHDKLVVILKWAEKNPSETYTLLEPIRRVKLDCVSPAYLRNLLNSHPVVSNNLAAYKPISDHLLEISEKLLEANESYRSGKETRVQQNSSGVGNDNNAQLHADIVKKEQLDTVALPAIPVIQTSRNQRHDSKQNVGSKSTACETVKIPCKRPWPCAQKCSTPKVPRLKENCRNKALSEALVKVLVNKTPDDIAIDQKGFAYVEDILKHRKFLRFALSEKKVYDLVKIGHFQIRATCGRPFELKSDSLDDDKLDSALRVTETLPGRPKMPDT